jgi:hypothetical protein
VATKPMQAPGPFERKFRPHCDGSAYLTLHIATADLSFDAITSLAASHVLELENSCIATPHFGGKLPC